VGESPSAYRARSHEAAAAVPPCMAMRLTRVARISRIGEAQASAPA